MRAKNAISRHSSVETTKRKQGVKVIKKVLRECKETLAKITLETLRLKKTTTLKSRMMMVSKSQRMEKTWLKEKRMTTLQYQNLTIMSKKVWTKHRNVRLIISSDVRLKENSTSRKESKLSVEVDKLQLLLMTKTLRIRKTLECSVSKSCAWGKREVDIREMELAKKMVLEA
jgi:hypothetical protein